MRISEANNFILQKLEKELPPHLSYHSIHHIKDVLEAAMELATLENINDADKKLLSTAVCFHDSGFLISPNKHEERGCEIAREILPQFNFEQEAIEKICNMIMATKIPQQPQNILEEIICDADLDYLGRMDFWEIGEKLFQELKTMNILQTEEEWNNLQIKFLQSHKFFTKNANLLRNNSKQKHLNKIIKIVTNYK